MTGTRTNGKTGTQAAATAHDSMQVEKEAQAAATGHEEKSSATGDNEQMLAEAQSSATGQRRKDDKPLLHPPEIDNETGPIRDTDEVAGWITGASPSIFQNETEDPYNFKLARQTWSYGARTCCVLGAGRLRRS